MIQKVSIDAAIFAGKARELTLDRQRYGEALTEFYSISGYDEATGIPRRDTLQRLGLTDVAADLESQGLLPH